MADRYWVGGTGTWSSTNTANWSATSGGAGGASVPTASDNVFFNVNSNVGTGSFTVTMANTPRVCNDITISGLDGAMTLAGSSIGLTVSGSLSFPATNFTRSYTGATTFNATTTGKTVTTNGVAFGGAVTFNGVGGAWTLGSAFNCGSSTLTITNGTFDTSATNYSVTCGNFTATASNLRTINLRASTINTSGEFAISRTSLTFNHTGTINLTSVSGALTVTGGSGAFPLNNVTFSGSSAGSARAISTTTSVSYNNLTVYKNQAAGTSFFRVVGTHTVTGTFQVFNTVTAAYARTYIYGYNSGWVVGTLSCATVASLTDVDFHYITISGAAAPVSGTRLGDAGGNSGVTFPAAKTVYYALTGATTQFVGNSWSATVGGALDITMYPLVQDTAVIPANYPASGQTIQIASVTVIGAIDMSARTTNTLTFSQSVSFFYICGNFTVGSGVTYSGNQYVVFWNYSTVTVTTNGVTLFCGFYLYGSIVLADNTNIYTSILYHIIGDLNLNGYTLTCGYYINNNGITTRSLTSGVGGKIRVGISGVSGANFCDIAGSIGITYNGQTTIEWNLVGSGYSTNVLGVNAQIANIPKYSFPSGSYTLYIFNYYYGGLNFSGYSGTIIFSSGNFFLAGDLTLSVFGSLSGGGGTFNFISPGGSITTNGRNFPQTTVIQSGTWTLQDALTWPNYYFYHDGGTLDLNGKTLTAYYYARTSTAKNITFNAGTILPPDANWVNLGTNLTTTAGTGEGFIALTATTGAKTFSGAGATYNCTLRIGGSVNLSVTGANTFNKITNSGQPCQLLLPAATTTTILSDLALNGTAGNLVTIGSSTAANHTLSKSSGTVSVSYCTISRSTATGGATWQAYTSNGNVDGGNNTGWVFFLPVIYDVFIAESSTVTDAFLAGLIYDSVFVDTATATDAASAQATFYADTTSTTTSTDAVTAQAVFYVATDDAATATDAVTKYVVFNAAVTDTATITDAIDAQAVFYAATSDTAAITDAITNAGSIYNAPFVAAASITDAITNAGSIYNAPFTDAVTATDVFSGAFLWNLIDDSQTVSWVTIPTNTPTTWTLVDASAPTTWQNIDTLN